MGTKEESQSLGLTQQPAEMLCKPHYRFWKSQQEFGCGFPEERRL